MKVGIGINPTRPDAARNALSGPEGLIDHTQLRLDPVLKCPECGHSADLPKTLPVVDTAEISGYCICCGQPHYVGRDIDHECIWS